MILNFFIQEEITIYWLNYLSSRFMHKLNIGHESIEKKIKSQINLKKISKNLLLKVQSRYNMVSLICFDVFISLNVVVLVYLRICNLFFFNIRVLVLYSYFNCILFCYCVVVPLRILFAQLNESLLIHDFISFLT